jgi:serine/threonine protein kinase
MTFVQRLAASGLLEPEQLAVVSAATGDDENTAARYLVEQNLLTRFQVRQLYVGATSFRVDKYIVLDCLGRGGNGLVLKARHALVPGHLVALKTLDNRDLHRTEATMARFRREIDIVTQLSHPNVVRALDVVYTRTQVYLVLEYIEGRDLATVVRERGPLAIPDAVSFAIQAARGLAYAHSAGIVHRDLKPANLLLTRDNVVKLSDLGLARFTGEKADHILTLKGTCLGTPEFMAPEQAEDASRADTRSDLYSLGATLFYLLTGQLPVRGGNFLHCLQQLLTAPPRPLATAREDVPPELAAVVDRLRSRKPEDRPATAEEVIRLLEPFAAGGAHVWDGQRKAALVLEILQGRTSADEACARWSISPDDLAQWQRCFLSAAAEALERVPGVEATGETFHDMPSEMGTVTHSFASVAK